MLVEVTLVMIVVPVSNDASQTAGAGDGSFHSGSDTLSQGSFVDNEAQEVSSDGRPHSGYGAGFSNDASQTAMLIVETVLFIPDVFSNEDLRVTLLEEGPQ